MVSYIHYSSSSHYVNVDGKKSSNTEIIESNGNKLSYKIKINKYDIKYLLKILNKIVKLMNENDYDNINEDFYEQIIEYLTLCNYTDIDDIRIIIRNRNKNSNLKILGDIKYILKDL